jgi:perosamine synthetase
VDCLGLGPGDEVILPSFTIISCALAVVRSGATPVVVDCDPDSYCIDVDCIRAAITPRTRAIMPVHMYGHPADMDPLLELARRHGLAVIEDAAQAHGSEYRSRPGGEDRWRRCGAMGDVSAFSFYANKLITTGEGGMVLTDDARVAERCRKLRNLYLDRQRFLHEELGYNFRLTNLQAAIGLAQCERFDAVLAKKRTIGERYDQRLRGMRGLKLPPRRDDARPNRVMYPIVIEDGLPVDGAALGERLLVHGVETRPFFIGMHEQPALRALGLFADVRLPVTERLSRRGLYLPAGVAISDAQIDRVAETLAAVLEAAH